MLPTVTAHAGQDDDDNDEDGRRGQEKENDPKQDKQDTYELVEKACRGERGWALQAVIDQELLKLGIDLQFRKQQYYYSDQFSVYPVPWRASSITARATVEWYV